MAATLGVAERISLERHAGEPKERADSQAASLTLVRQPQHGLAAIAYDLTPVIDVGRLRLTGR